MPDAPPYPGDTVARCCWCCCPASGRADSVNVTETLTLLTVTAVRLSGFAGPGACARRCQCLALDCGVALSLGHTVSRCADERTRSRMRLRFRSLCEAEPRVAVVSELRSLLARAARLASSRASSSLSKRRARRCTECQPCRRVAISAVRRVIAGEKARSAAHLSRHV